MKSFSESNQCASTNVADAKDDTQRQPPYRRIRQATLSINRLNLGQLQTKYGSQARPDTYLCEQYRLTLKVCYLKSLEASEAKSPPERGRSSELLH